MWRIYPFVTQHQRLKLLRIFMKFSAGNLYKNLLTIMCLSKLSQWKSYFTYLTMNHVYL